MSRKAASHPWGRFVLGMVLAAVFFTAFVLLGNWQVRREAWKLALIHDVATRVHAPPVAAPGPEQWPRIEQGDLQYLHVRLRGRFLSGDQTLVHGASELGYGYWVMAPLATDRGFIVLVNRGYVPAGLPGTPAFAKAAPPAGDVTLTGLLRFSEPGGGFLRPNRPGADQWYSRDVAAIAAARGRPRRGTHPNPFPQSARGLCGHLVPAGAGDAGRRGHRHPRPLAGLASA